MSANKYIKKVKGKNGYKEQVMWEVHVRYKDYMGNVKKKHKKGFIQRKDALLWEKEFLDKVTDSTEMTFKSLYEKYIDYFAPIDGRTKIKASSLENKIEIFQIHILPFFSEYKINNIEPIDIIRWHNDREQYISKNGKKLSTAYLKKMHGQLSAIFNFAIKFYNLKRNPASIAGNFVEETEEIKEDVIQQEQWWDVNQYQVFAEAAMDNDFYYHLFETLYWNGLRIGEALALRKKDFDFANKRLYVRGNSSGRKCARNEEGKLIFSKSITSPKNGKSRCIQMFDSYAEEMEDFISRLYNLQDNDIIFNVAKRTVQNHWKSIWKKTNLPYMNLHGTRHSHVSLLFSLGFNVVQIAQRLGHQETSITYMYAGILKSDEKEMMMKLDKIRNEVNNYGV